MNILRRHKLFSIPLSLLIVFSTLSLSVEKHFCGDILVYSAIFTKAKSCCAIDIPSSDDSEKSCCTNEVDIIQGVDEFQMTHRNTEVLKIASVLNSSYSESSQITFNSKVKVEQVYRPPALVFNYQAFYETYLI